MSVSQRGYFVPPGQTEERGEPRPWLDVAPFFRTLVARLLGVLFWEDVWITGSTANACAAKHLGERMEMQ